MRFIIHAVAQVVAQCVAFGPVFFAGCKNGPHNVDVPRKSFGPICQNNIYMPRHYQTEDLSIAALIQACARNTLVRSGENKVPVLLF